MQGALFSRSNALAKPRSCDFYETTAISGTTETKLVTCQVGHRVLVGYIGYSNSGASATVANLSWGSGGTAFFREVVPVGGTTLHNLFGCELLGPKGVTVGDLYGDSSVATSSLLITIGYWIVGV